MTKTLACKELGGVCDETFSGDTLMEVMAAAMPHMQSDQVHRDHIAKLSESTGESQEQWFSRMQQVFESKADD